MKRKSIDSEAEESPHSTKKERLNLVCDEMGVISDVASYSSHRSRRTSDEIEASVETTSFVSPLPIERKISLSNKSQPIEMSSLSIKKPSNLIINHHETDVNSLYSLPLEVSNLVLKTPRNVKSIQVTSLHKAVQSLNESMIEEIFHQNTFDINAQEEHGYTALMNLSALTSSENVTRIANRLLLHDSLDINICDNEGFTALHWAAYSDNITIAKLLITKDKFNVFALSNLGETPLHRACRYGNSQFINFFMEQVFYNKEYEAFLREFHANNCRKQASSIYPFLLDCQLNSPLDVCGIVTLKGKLDLKKFNQSRQVLFKWLPFLKTLIIHHPATLLHNTGDSHQESSNRITSVLDNMKKFNLINYEVTVENSFKKVEISQIKKVHSKDYINKVLQLSKEVNHRNTTLPFTPCLKSILQQEEKEDGGGEEEEDTKLPSGGTSKESQVLLLPSHSHSLKNKTTEENETSLTSASLLLHAKNEIILNRIEGTSSDTPFSKGSLDAALFAGGSIIHAIDQVLKGSYRNAFCLVRPPGHHAAYDGGANLAHSCGFCIFNNVCIGLMYALDEYKDTVHKVAIIDFDVHHGNGTEDIIRVINRPNNILFISIHLHDKAISNDEFSFFPYSGDKSDVRMNIYNFPLEPLWRSSLVNPKRAEEPKLGRNAFKEKFINSVIPLLRVFLPDLILLSSGFDAGNKDIGNRKLGCDKFIGGMDLEGKDFFTLTKEVLNVSKFKEGGSIPVVSILEGGYGSYKASVSTNGSGSGGGVSIGCENFANNVLSHISALTGKHL